MPHASFINPALIAKPYRPVNAATVALAREAKQVMPSPPAYARGGCLPINQKRLRRVSVFVSLGWRYCRVGLMRIAQKTIATIIYFSFMILMSKQYCGY